MKIQIINIFQLRNRFSEYLSRAENGERFLIMRRARPLAALISVGDLRRLERSAALTRRFAQTFGQSAKLIEDLKSGKVHPAMAAFGLWKHEDDRSELEKQIMNNRQRSSTRPNAGAS